MPLIDSSFRPALGLGHGVAQTVFPLLARRLPAVPVVRERWDTRDGDFVDVDVLPAERPEGFLVIVHGLEGSSRSQYVLGMLARAARAGLGAIALNFRSCSGEMNRYARSYHSGETGDLGAVVERAIERWPGIPGAIAGFSLGANVTLRRLAEWGRGGPDAIRAAVAVSCPFDLALCGDTLDTPSSFWVRSHFLYHLKRKALAKAAVFPSEIDARRVRAARTIRRFDDIVTAPLNGFRDAAEYWERCSSGPVLDRVARPVLLLSARDDPLIPASCHPVEVARGSDLLHLEAPARGGHVGFVAGSLLAPRFYAEERAMEFIGERLGLSARADAAAPAGAPGGLQAA